jgi:hypothetical protein
MRTAIASKKIHDWLEELSDWPWPAGGTSAGFNVPPAKRRKLSEPRGPPNDPDFSKSQQPPTELETSYFGSLPARDVIQYEMRIEQIHKDMEELGLEEIKTHVLHNHIMPLSRPGSPFSDAGRSVASSMSFNKMEDMTAVITAITVQALPNLSRLSRLLNTWSVRLVVLRKVPSVLMMIADAEVALKSGWSAITVDGEDYSSAGAHEDQESATLTRKDFEVMNLVLQQKVAKPGRDLDYMLDALEGMQDTLPDDWLDQMDAVEKDYAEWVATAERRVRKGEWSHFYEPLRLERPALEPETPRPKIEIQTPSPTRDQHEASESNEASSPPTPFDHSSVASASYDRSLSSSMPTGEDHSSDDLGAPVKKSSQDVSRPVNHVLDANTNATHKHEVDLGIPVENSILVLDEKPPATTILADHMASDAQDARGYDGSADPDRASALPDRYEDEASPVLSEVDRNIVRITPAEGLGPSPNFLRKPVQDLDNDYSYLESVHEEEEEEPELPPARFPTRRGSQGSIASTAIHGSASGLNHSDNDVAREESVEPEFARLRDPDEPFSSDALSPPSSPPLRYKPRSTSVSFNDIPEIATLPERSVTPPRSPFEPSEIFDPESSFDYGSRVSTPGRMSVGSVESELHQQISQVLKNLPNNIHLTSKPSAINLNPPDLQLPTRPKAKVSDAFRRSGSAMSTRSTMSSRAGTPSFLLAPAKASRPQSRASNEVKTYYLSRSTGEAPMKLLIRCVGENNERVMVRVGGGWADLGEYLKEYAAHHGRKSKGEGKVEIRDMPTGSTGGIGSSPPSRPASALSSPMTPLAVRKTRKSLGEEQLSKTLPTTPLVQSTHDSDTPSSGTSQDSFRGPRFKGDVDALGLSGPKPKKARALSEENKSWIEDVKTKVRTASGDQRLALEQSKADGKFGEMGKVGATKRLFRKNLGAHD